MKALGILAIIMLLVSPVGAQEIQSVVGMTHAAGPGVLPEPTTPLMTDRAHFGGIVCSCDAGYAQNWYLWQAISQAQGNCSSDDPFPEVALEDLTAEENLCPPVAPGMHGTHKVIGGDSFTLPPTLAVVTKGDLLGLVVTKQGLCDGEADYPFQTGGEIWITAILAPTAQDCP